MTSRIDRQPAPAAFAKRRPRPSRRSGVGGTLLGVFIGIAIGLGLAAGVAFYLNRAGNPYQANTAGREAAREAPRDSAKPGRPETGTAEKPRFDFYRILPGAEEPKLPAKSAERTGPDRVTAERAASPDKTLAKIDERASPPAADRTAKAADRFWLQAGSFATMAEAEGLKARLAFAGWEATIQSVTLPDKGVRYRVRLGPYDSTDEMTRMKGELATRGFDVAVIKF